MMNEAHFEYLHRTIDLIARKQFPAKDFTPEQRAAAENWQIEEFPRLELQLNDAWRKYRDKKTSEEERKKIEKNLENAAKALPGVTNGTLSAITAFKNGDAISGSAAIMDICASLTPLVAGLSAAGGPPGMLVGAIFSIVGQILSFFAPQSDPLKSQIEKLLKDLKAEDIKNDIITVRQNIWVYTESLREAANSASDAIDKSPPLFKKAMEEAMINGQPLFKLKAIKNISKKLNAVEGNTVVTFRKVMNWLNEPNYQTLDLWPTILAAACNAWADMMAAALTLLSLVNTDQVQNQYEAAKELKTGEVEKKLRELQVEVFALLTVLKANNDLLLKILAQLVPAAQNRGMFWMIGENARLYTGTNIKEGIFSDLGGEGKCVSVVVPRRDIGSPHRTYYQLGLEYSSSGDAGLPGYDRTYISEVKPPYKSQDSRQLVDENGRDDSRFHSLSDIWAEPGDKSNNIKFYTAKGNFIRGYNVEIEKDWHKARGSGYNAGPLKADVKSVRVLHNPEAFLDDPDNTPGVMTGVDYCVYGGLARENSDIYVDIGQGKSGYVPSPWGGYDGVRVDRHYLWVFGSASFACATHASIVRFLNKEVERPQWIEHWPKELPLYTEEYNRDKDKVPKDVYKRCPLKGLVDVCPCDDGTLVAALYTRSVNAPAHMSYVFPDQNALYTAVYQTDLKKRTINVKWTKIEVSTGVRVQKLPVFCWSLFESLPVMLNRLAPLLASDK
jgi:hypothetical protein